MRAAHGLGEAAIAAFRSAGGDAGPPAVRELVVALGEDAPALLPLALRDPTLPAEVLERPLARGDDLEDYRRIFRDATRSLDDGPELWRRLRELRHRAVVRIALREIFRQADIDRTSAEMSWMASAAIDTALAACTRRVTTEWGIPTDESGAPVPVVVLGMGKLGGGELNIGSDIDLCFFYGTDEAGGGDDAHTAHEVIARIAASTARALSKITDEGFAFRVDLRLRPEGSRGVLVNSLASAERYYETFGRTWERAALLRARPVAGDLAFGERLVRTLRPFVFRRSVDPSLADQLMEMLRRSRVELGVDLERDIKLGRGGIREAEFFVQSQQLVWGGRYPELQVAGTIEAIRRLQACGLLTDRVARFLEADWALLRRVEHRIHVGAGHQTHELPPPGDRREVFARSLGFPTERALSTELDAARERVAHLFASSRAGREAAHPQLAALCDMAARGAPAVQLGEAAARALDLPDADEAGAQLHRLGRHAEAPLGPGTRLRFPELGPLLLAEVAEAADPQAALRWLAEFFSRLGGPWGYRRLLRDEPRLTRRLVGLFGASATLSRALACHPEWLYELLGRPPVLSGDSVESMHAEPPFDWRRTPPEPESLAGALRRTKMLVTLQAGLSFVGGELDIGAVQRVLTALADAQIATALRYAGHESLARLGHPSPRSGHAAGLTVFGLGKLGAREMGFGADLDLVFLYSGRGAKGSHGAGAGDAELCTRIAQRTMQLLSQQDPAGPGYRTDTRLRPGGNQGMLVVSLAHFERYHAEEAALWERQAWIRARAVAGDAEVARRVEQQRAGIAFRGGRDPGPSIAAMRRRIEVELSGERLGRYHPKLGHGGLIDVEFVVQCLQMRHADDEGLRSPATLEALDALRAKGLLDPADADVLADGYRFFRAVEQSLKLMDETRDASVVEGGRVWDRVARQLGLRDRDGERAREVLGRSWRCHAGEVRALFERLVAPMACPPPWGST